MQGQASSRTGAGEFFVGAGRVCGARSVVYGVTVFGYVTAALATLFIAQVPERAATDASS